MKLRSNQETLTFIRSLNGYRGYIQFSHRPIDRERDIFVAEDPSPGDEEGFVHEAHFSNDSESVAIRQINDGWCVSRTDISRVPQEDIQHYQNQIAGFTPMVKMAQIWETQSDPLCEGMEVSKLKKVVFAGFTQGGEA